MPSTPTAPKPANKKRRWGRIILITLGVLLILFWNGLIIIGNNWGNVLTVLQIPMAWQYMPLAIGSGASMIFVVYDLDQILRGKSREERYGADE